VFGKGTFCGEKVGKETNQCKSRKRRRLTQKQEKQQIAEKVGKMVMTH
jgi:hypothetical protein